MSIYRMDKQQGSTVVGPLQSIGNAIQYPVIKEKGKLQGSDRETKTLMLGKIEGGRRRGRQRMRWLDGITSTGHEFVLTLAVGDRQGGLACCSPWGCKESDRTE